MRDTLVMLLAGGGGTRLNILAGARAKPAVPFGGMYRIIDFTMSNVMNSGIDRVAVLTQYKPLSLNEHIGRGEAWELFGRTRGAKILPPRTGEAESDWYKGTADAIRQNFDYIDRMNPERLLILSGDHIYNMNYAPLIDFHQDHSADVTIATMRVPEEDTRHFGIAVTDDEMKIVEWQEKPIEARSDLASLGIYVFNTAYLRKMLGESGRNDFGHDIIPAALENDRVFAYPFDGYWRDVGTLHAYYDTNMDLIRPGSELDLGAWRVRTNLELDGVIADRPPALIAGCAEVDSSIIGPGCHIEGRVVRSILSPGVRIAKGAVVSDSIIMHDVSVGENAEVTDTIIDKGGRVGGGSTIGVGDRSIANKESPDHLHTGLTIIGKGAAVPAGRSIGRNSILAPYLPESAFPGVELPPGSTLTP